MQALSRGKVNINGYICPGHVSAIIGSDAYTFIPDNHHISCVVTGFEPLDILQGIVMLVEQIRSNKPSVQVQYSRVVKPEGNLQAKEVLASVFKPCDSDWRGIGTIPGSGMQIRNEFARWDTEIKLPVEVEPTQELKGCLCGQVLQGLVKPSDCRLFAKQCVPENPVGPCMVSSEGTCAAYYKYDLS